MDINPLIFRAYDIRGIAQLPLDDTADLTPETMYGLGQGVGTYYRRLKEKTSDNLIDKRKASPCVAVGKDNRLSSDSLHEAFVSGLLTTGCTVIDIGYATSPMVYYASCVLDVDGGANITASHNPKQYNGVKLVARDAHSVCGDELQVILKIIQDEDFVSGKGELFSKDVFPQYLEDVKKRITLKTKSGVKLKIVVDAGNGIAGAFAPKLLRELGCEVVELYCEPDGNFPNHEANPESEKNMKDLMARVVVEKADLGIGFDGDGDRVGIIDENGKHYHSDFVLIPLARDILSRNPGATIIFDTKSSRVLENDITTYGGRPIRYKTGHSFIETKMRETGAPLAGETSGHIFFKENWYGFDDGMYAAARIIELLDRIGKPFSAFFDGLPQIFTTPEWKIPCPDNSKFRVVSDVKTFFTKRYPCLTIDGVWVDFGHGAWGAVRPSNTSPCLTARFEAQDEKTLALIQKIFMDKLKEYPEVDLNRMHQ